MSVEGGVPSLVDSLLRSNALCFLATCDDNKPHLSLMNFTYAASETSLIMTTRKNTQKFAYIQNNPHAAVLIHSCADESDSQHHEAVSATLNGIIQVIEGPEQERFRALHLENRPGYKQFIVGDDIAVVLFRIDRARVCDFQDKVTTWERSIDQ